MAQNLRVAIRFRPVNKVEHKQPGNKVCVKTAMGKACKVYRDNMPSATFTFDQVYAPGVAQQDVYNYTGKPLVEQVFEGFNSTIFAYGQTGSGKTYSMMGVAGSEEHAGMIPRICRDVFDRIESDKSGDKFRVFVSMLQIYCERVADLFNPMNDNMRLREEKGGRVYAQGMTRNAAFTAAEVMDFIDDGCNNRATSATSMNAESSRSHMVVILELERLKASGGKVLSSCKMVDLAGSEKTTKTNATGDRLREAKSINKSLTQLGTVMKALTDAKATFVPYRDSKLTMLLKDSLGGNSKTSLLCATSPCSYNVEETMSTLRFAALAKKVKTKAVIMEEKTLEEYQKDEKKTKALIADLKKRLALSEATLEEFQQWVLANNGQSVIEEILANVRVVDPEAEAELDTSNLEFEECSSQMVVLNKKTGKVEAGSLFSTKAKMLGFEEEKKMSAEVMVEGNAFAEEHGLTAGGVDPEIVMDLKHRIIDLEVELDGNLCHIDGLQFDLESSQQDFERALNAASKYETEIAQARFFQQKASFLEKDVLAMLRQVRMETKLMESQLEDCDNSATLAFDPANPDAAIKQAQQQINKLRRSLKKKNQLLHKQLAFRELDQEKLRKFDTLGVDQQRVLLAKALANCSCAKLFVASGKEKFSKAQERLQAVKNNAKYQKNIRTSWQAQMSSMEKSLLLAKQVHQRDAQKAAADIKVLQERVQKLTDFVAKKNALEAASANTPNAPSQAGAPPQRRRNKQRRRRRPSRNAAA